MQELPANITEHYKNINYHLNLKTTKQTQRIDHNNDKHNEESKPQKQVINRENMY